VPDGVRTLFVRLLDAQGGADAFGDAGVDGMAVSGGVPATPGQALYAEVGGAAHGRHAPGRRRPHGRPESSPQLRKVMLRGDRRNRGARCA
jgi:hypothetical protein